MIIDGSKDPQEESSTKRTLGYRPHLTMFIDGFPGPHKEGSTMRAIGNRPYLTMTIDGSLDLQEQSIEAHESACGQIP